MSTVMNEIQSLCPHEQVRSVYDDNAQDSVREKMAGGGRLGWNPQGQALEGLTFQLIHRIQLCERLV